MEEFCQHGGESCKFQTKVPILNPDLFVHMKIKTTQSRDTFLAPNVVCCWRGWRARFVVCWT